MVRWRSQMGRVLIGVGLLVVVFAGTGAPGGRPAVPEDPAWFQPHTNADHLGQVLQLVHDAEVTAFFQERFRDRDGASLLRAGGTTHFGGVAPAVAPRVLHPRAQDASARADGLGGDFTGDAAGRERTGWGWLADDVQQLRGAETAAREIGEEPAFPRRLEDTDGGFSARRWLEE